MLAGLIRPGDVVVLAAGIALVTGLVWHAVERPQGTLATVRAGGKVVLTTALTHPRVLRVAGPLGTTLIEFEPGRARVRADPSPRQLCVRQGWLSRAGDAALCLPNQVSLELQSDAVRVDTRAY